jgi:FtsZ-binding cell division protein ZapB
MELTIEQFERIEAYLQGQLDTIKLLAFEAEMAENPALKEEVEAQRQVRFGLEVLAAEQRIKAAHRRHVEREVVEETKTESQIEEKEVLAKTVPLGRTTSTPFSYTNWAVAASVVLVLGLGGWWYQNRYHNSQDSDYISPDALAMVAEENKYKALPIDFPKDANEADKRQLELQKIQWFMILDKIARGKKQEAKAELKKIAAIKGHPYQAKAKKLLEKL